MLNDTAEASFCSAYGKRGRGAISWQQPAAVSDVRSAESSLRSAVREVQAVMLRSREAIEV